MESGEHGELRIADCGFRISDLAEWAERALTAGIGFGVWILKFGFWNFFGFWILEFGISPAHPSCLATFIFHRASPLG
jgi:hypothetical protein